MSFQLTICIISKFRVDCSSCNIKMITCLNTKSALDKVYNTHSQHETVFCQYLCFKAITNFTRSMADLLERYNQILCLGKFRWWSSWKSHYKQYCAGTTIHRFKTKNFWGFCIWLLLQVNEVYLATIRLNFFVYLATQ